MKNNVYYIAKKKYEKNKATTIKYLLYLILAILLVITGYYLIKNNQPAIIQAKYEEITDGFETEALIVRDEKIILAPVSGQVELKQKEGERIKYGNPVISINNTKNLTLYNQVSGIISYANDGLESRLTPARLHKINIEEFNNIKGDYSRLVTGNIIKKGQPLYRIIDNYRLFLIIKTSLEEAQRYAKNEVVFVKDKKANSDFIKGQVIQIATFGNQALLKLKLNRFVDQWINMRRVKIELIKNIYRGIVIPREAIFTQPEGQGILVLTTNGNYKFKNVKIKDGTKNKVVVTGLEIGDNVLLDPASVKYGKGGND